MAEYRKKDLSDEAFEMLGEQFKAFSEPMRLKLVYTLMDGEKTVSELVEETGGLQANVSKHLRMLLEAGIVERRKQGLNSYYSIADDSIFELCDLMCNSIQERLTADLKSFSTSS
ncbi:MAG: metalloregulator ArsR/SmtB family transcription factor [Actinomycetota bacterium]|nr:metalloregulator ArsR/SmtB family transcription factor [Actinomycetota bacterium]HZY64817.1 metalloregulator ArsR/SmtB family transcription factor [Rubrobacteraceae bacterium]